MRRIFLALFIGFFCPSFGMDDSKITFKDGEEFTPQAATKFNLPVALQCALKNNPANKPDIRKLCLILFNTSSNYTDNVWKIGDDRLGNPKLAESTTYRKRVALFYARSENWPETEAELIRAIAEREDWTPSKTQNIILEFWRLKDRLKRKSV